MDDWFERLTGFPETGYEEVRRKLEVDGSRLRSRVNGRSYAIGQLELVSLQNLRERVRSDRRPGRTTVRLLTGDVRRLHQMPEFNGALFQVASQFNLLEMVSPHVTPEHGVTRYQSDRTQGPACAIAAGAATIYRNYFAPVGGQIGQTSERQLDGLSDLGAALGTALGEPVSALWTMRNGYALCTSAGLDAITDHLASLTPEETDRLRGMLRIGVHQGVEVTDVESANPPIVTQAFCSALPVAYSPVSRVQWKAFASLVLEAAYEATLWAAVDNANRGGTNVVLLTRLGGGAFGNDDDWITAGMRRALQQAGGMSLDVRLISHGLPPPPALQLAAEFA
jgi:hypothetical protein